MTRGDDEEPRELFTRLGEHLTTLHLTHMPVRRETRDLCQQSQKRR